MGNQIPCKRCLLKELDESDYFKNLYDYINGLDNDIKTKDLEYQKRLSICKECDNLISGMCRLCGCFVELRAAIQTNYCPNSVKKW